MDPKEQERGPAAPPSRSPQAGERAEWPLPYDLRTRQVKRPGRTTYYSILFTRWGAEEVTRVYTLQHAAEFAAEVGPLFGALDSPPGTPGLDRTQARVETLRWEHEHEYHIAGCADPCPLADDDEEE